jgi:rhodanese-related sulfurtransferase
LIVLPAILSNCAYITGEAIKSPAPIPSAVSAVKNITPEDANILLVISSIFINIIDVRTPLEYAGGHIGNAINIDFNAADFKEKISKLDKNAGYLVYCRTGARSAAASNVMAELGFKDFFNMTGGISAWEAAGLPVVK